MTPDKGDYMGLSMVTEQFHYVQWREWDDARKVVGGLSAEELYDLINDPDENRNIANIASSKRLTADLAAQLNAGWRAALPPE